jgi:hypothetical protein
MARAVSVDATGFTADDCFHGFGGNGNSAVNGLRGLLTGNDDMRATTRVGGASVRPATSWSRAVDKTYGSTSDDRNGRAVRAALFRMLVFHCSQPLIFFYLFDKYDQVIHDLGLSFWTAGVLIREFISAGSLAACTYYNPAFLLVDIAKSYNAAPPMRTLVGGLTREAMQEMGVQHINSGALALFGVPLNDGYVFRFHHGSGWWFAITFVLAPEKFVLTALLGPVLTKRASKATLVFFVACLFFSFIFDAFGFMALLIAAARMPVSLAFGFAVSGELRAR